MIRTMKHLEKSLDLFKNYLDTTPREEVLALISKIDSMVFGGPTTTEYFTQLDQALQADNWMGNWPAPTSHRMTKFGFEKLTRVDMETGFSAWPTSLVLEEGAEFTSKSLHTAA